MAKKAKRRGRPPGSKNKKPNIARVGNGAKMDVGQLRAYIDSLQSVLAKKVTSFAAMPRLLLRRLPSLRVLRLPSRCARL